MTIYCPRCGQPEPEPASFCRLCGLPISEHANLLNEATDTERTDSPAVPQRTFAAPPTTPLATHETTNPHEPPEIGLLRALLRALVADVKRAKRRTSLPLLVTMSYSAAPLYERADEEAVLESLGDKCKEVLLRAYEKMIEFGHYVEQRQQYTHRGGQFVNTGLLLLQLGPETLQLALRAAELLEPEIDRLVRQHLHERSPN